METASSPAPGPSSGTSFTTSFSPIMIWYSIAVCLQVIIVVFPGVYYSRTGISPPASRRTMSTISFNLLLPAMSFVNIGSQLSRDTLYQIWPFLVNALLSNFTGLMCGWLTCVIFRPPKKFRAHVLTTCGFGNLNAMPLLLTQALCGQGSLPFYQYFGSVQECANVGFGYVAIGSAANQILTYPIAIYLLQNTVEDEDTDPSHKLGDIQEEGSVSQSSKLPQDQVPANIPSERFKSKYPYLQMGESQELVLPMSLVSTEYSRLSKARSLDTCTMFRSNRLISSSSLVIVPHARRELGFWKSDNGFYRRLPEDDAPLGEEDGQAAFIDATEETMDLLSLDPGRTSDYATSTFLRRRKYFRDPKALQGKRASQVLLDAALPRDDEENDEGSLKSQPSPLTQKVLIGWNILKIYVLKPPFCGALAGIIVVLIPELQNLLYPIQDAALGFVSGSMRSISNALVFVSSFVVGGSMSKGPGEGTKQIGWKPCVAVSFTRFVVLPAVGAVIIIGSNKLGIWTPYNPVYIIILLLQYCVPTANQMQNIASMYGNYESAMGTLIFWEYIAMLFFVPFWLCIYLILLSEFDVYASIISS